MTDRRALTQQVKIALADPRKLANVLGLLDRTSQRQGKGVIVRCPAHKDAGRPNLSITTGRDGTARCKCHACGWTGDALSLVALIHGIEMREGFAEVLQLGAELAGDHLLAAELADGKARPERTPLPPPPPAPEAPWAA